MPFTSPISAETRAEARKLYESTQRSCREIADQLDLPGPTVQTWARRGGWLRTGVNPAKALQTKAKVKLEQRIQCKIEAKANEVAESAALIQRKMVDEAGKWLETVTRVREQIDSTGMVDVEEFAKATGGMKNVVEINRKLHGLDADDGRPRITAELRLQIVDLDRQPLEQQANVIDVTDVESEPTQSQGRLASGEANAIP